MTYFVSLKIVAIVIGLLYLAGHLPLAIAPGRFLPYVKAMPRNYPLGAALMLLATLWFVVLTGVMDLGELSGTRLQLMTVWAVAGVLMTIFVRDFLTARALGCLLLLAAAVILDAAFLVETPARYVMTLLAYAWVVAGMVFVYSPHLWRDAVEFTTRTPSRCRLFCAPGALLGAVLIILGLFVYPS